MEQAFEFAKWLSQYYVVFNPLTIYDWNIIKEWQRIADEAAEKGKQTPESFQCEVPYPSGPRVYTCDTAEMKRIVVDARYQIVHRDYKMIDSADCVVVYHPRKEISVGAVCEMVEGKRAVKKVYAYYPFEPSPWLAYHATKIERDEKSFRALLERASTA